MPREFSHLGGCAGVHLDGRCFCLTSRAEGNDAPAALSRKLVDNFPENRYQVELKLANVSRL